MVLPKEVDGTGMSKMKFWNLYNDASGVKRRVSYLCSPFRALPTMYAQVLLNSVDEPGSFFPVLLLIINSRLQRKGNNERLI